jgi:gas vesicle protein
MMNDNGKLLGTLLLGVAAGAAIGVLFAPERGSETRRKLVGNAEDLVDQLSTKINEGKRALVDMKDRAVGKAEELKETAKREMNDLSNTASSAAGNYGRKGVNS